jgi:hypothetical protein
VKYLVTLFLVLLALQPPALQACAMDDDQPASHHETMQHGEDPACCDGNVDGDVDGDDPAEPCDEAAQCAFFSLGFLVIPPASAIDSSSAGQRYDLLDTNPHSGPPARRLLRPPIA